MDLYNSAIAEYEDTLVGKQKAISTYYFSYGKYGNQRLALQIMKYAFETYLGWSPATLRDYISNEIFNRLQLKPLLHYIEFPPELDPKKDLFYIIHLIYPDVVRFSKKDLVLHVFQQLLEGSIMKFPKEFFTGADGEQRAQICLRYILEQKLTFVSVQEAYAFFSTPNCLKLLNKYKLLSVCRDLYDSPLTYLHYSLPSKQQDVFWYRYYDFCCKRAQLRKAQEAGDSR